MTLPAIYADFMNADPQGRVRLNNVGTVEDLFRQGLHLADGLRVLLHDDELEVDGQVAYAADEQVWVAVIDWDALRHVTKPAVSPRV